MTNFFIWSESNKKFFWNDKFLLNSRSKLWRGIGVGADRTRWILKSVTLSEALSGSDMLFEQLLQSLPTILGCFGVIAWTVVRMKTVLGLVINTDFRDRSTGLQTSIHSIHTVQGYSSIFPFIESQDRPIELVAIIGCERTWGNSFESWLWDFNSQHRWWHPQREASFELCAKK